MTGTRTLPVQVPAHARTGPMRSLRVTVLDGPDRGLSVSIAKRNVVVGRAATADVRLGDPTVSQFHAELQVVADGVVITDLGSANGIRAAGLSLLQARVPAGTEIGLGETRIRVGHDDEFVLEVSKATSFGELVGDSVAMREVYAVLERLAKTDLSVLIEGETGTGKELAARALHAAGHRARGPFVTVDCTAIPPTLAESILFGHERGAFTGATEQRQGLLEAASGGTLFFDEIGDLGADLQPKLLRVLERREVTPVGSNHARSIDVRILAATWRDLRSMVNARTFREDLYFRVAQTHLRLPSLDERPEDIKPLVQHVLAGIPWTLKAARAIDSDALTALASRRFAGNVRELKSTVERLAMLSEGPTITLADLAFDRVLQGGVADGDPPAPRDSVPPSAPPDPSRPLEPFKQAKRTVVDDFERDYLTRLLARAGTNVSRAASLAGIERQTLRDLMKRHGLRGEE